MVCFSLISLFCSCHLSYHSTCASCQVDLGHQCQFGDKSRQLGNYYLLERSLIKSGADTAFRERKKKQTERSVQIKDDTSSPQQGGKSNAVIGSQSHQDLACPFWGQNEGQGTVAVSTGSTSRRGRYGGRHVGVRSGVSGELGPPV